MKMEVAIWNSQTCIGYEYFSSPEELNEFMDILKQVDDSVTYKLKRVVR